MHAILLVGLNQENDIARYADVWDGKVKEMPLSRFIERFADPNNSVSSITIPGAVPYSFETLKDFQKEQKLEESQELQEHEEPQDGPRI